MHPHEPLRRHRGGATGDGAWGTAETSALVSAHSPATLQPDGQAFRSGPDSDSRLIWLFCRGETGEAIEKRQQAAALLSGSRGYTGAFSFIRKELPMVRFGRAVLFALVFISVPLSAQTIRGRVLLQSDDSPLPGVTVSVDDWGLSTVTDSDGRYEIAAPGRRGTVEVTAVLPGFQTRTETVTVGES